MREKCEQWQLALGLQAETRSVSVLAYVITYNAAITVCSSGRDAKRSLDIKCYHHPQGLYKAFKRSLKGL